MNAMMTTALALMAFGTEVGAFESTMPCPDFYEAEFVTRTSPKVYYTYQSVGEESVSCAVSSWQDAQPELRDPNLVTSQQVVEHVLRTKRNARIYAVDVMTVDPGDYTLARMKVSYQGDSPPAVSTGSPRLPETGEPPMVIASAKTEAATLPPPPPPKRVASKSHAPKASSGMTDIILNGLSQVASTYAASKGAYVTPSATVVSTYASTPRSGSPGDASASFRAPLAPASCATYRIAHWEPLWNSAAVEWRNNCNFPVEVKWCWVQTGQSNCKIDNASPILSPGQTKISVGPTGVRDPVASYYVCDMSDSSKSCAQN